MYLTDWMAAMLSVTYKPVIYLSVYPPIHPPIYDEPLGPLHFPLTLLAHLVSPSIQYSTLTIHVANPPPIPALDPDPYRTQPIKQKNE